MDFEVTPEQRELCEQVEQFARSRLGESAGGDGFSRERWRVCAEQGLLGVHVPVTFGGAGYDPLKVVLVLESLGYACPDNGLLFSVNAHLWTCVTPILGFGSEEQKGTFLPRLCSGDVVGAGAATEEGAGSDVFALATSAERRAGGGWVLNGSKRFITNAPAADLFVVLATCDPDAGAAGLASFLVERGTPGLKLGPPLETMGLRSAAVGTLELSDCELPETALLGEPGDGMGIFALSMLWERTCILACAVGTMRRQLERSTAYARTRHQFAHPLASFQAVSHRLAEMKVRLEAARLLLHRGGWLLAQRRATALDASVTKLYVSEAFVASSLDALAIHGGNGYLRDWALEADVRDALGSRVYGGTSDMQRNIIAGLLPA
jgi:alkylation response protein AidB-like acyl-CoA dehydrogenase